MSKPTRDPATIVRRVQALSERGAVRYLRGLKLTPAERRAVGAFVERQRNRRVGDRRLRPDEIARIEGEIG